jgi:hypothetical protein
MSLPEADNRPDKALAQALARFGERRSKRLAWWSVKPRVRVMAHCNRRCAGIRSHHLRLEMQLKGSIFSHINQEDRRRDSKKYSALKLVGPSIRTFLSANLPKKGCVFPPTARIRFALRNWTGWLRSYANAESLSSNMIPVRRGYAITLASERERSRGFRQRRRTEHLTERLTH